MRCHRFLDGADDALECGQAAADRFDCFGGRGLSLGAKPNLMLYLLQTAPYAAQLIDDDAAVRPEAVLSPGAGAAGEPAAEMCATDPPVAHSRPRRVQVC